MNYEWQFKCLVTQDGMQCKSNVRSLKKLTALMRVLQWTINLLSLLALATTIYTARSLIFNDIEVLWALAAGFQLFFFPHLTFLLT